MRGLFVVAVLAANASADSPRGIALASEHTELLGGHVRLRLAEGMVVIDDNAAVLEWGASRFAVECTALSAGAGDMRELLARDRELGSARVERLAIVRAGAAYGATPSLVHLAHDRALAYEAVVSAPNAAVAMLRFYVSADGIDDARAWTTVARAISATLDVRGDRSPPPQPPPVVATPQLAELPHGWTMVSKSNTHRIFARRGTCDVLDGELDARAIAPASAKYDIGLLRGETVYWSLWTDRGGYHAETLIGAAHAGQLHARCTASNAADLAKQREIVEAMWR